MKLQDAIQYQALFNTLHPDYDYTIRYIIRWYSRTFNTPISQVKEIPIDELLLEYYESKYEEMDETEVQFELDRLLETEAERKAKAQAIEEQEVSDMQFARQVAAEEAEAQKETNVKANSPPQPPPLPPESLPPDIKLTFLEPNLFEEALEGFGVMPDPVKK